MGTGVLTPLGDPVRIVAPAHINRAVSAVRGDVIPRSLRGVPTDGAADLGTASNPWGDIHFSGRITVDGVVQNLQPQEPRAGSYGQVSHGIRGTLASAFVAQGRVVGGESAILVPKGSEGVEIRASSELPLVVFFKDGFFRRLEANITVPLMQTRAAGKDYTLRTALSADTHQAAFRGTYWGCRAMGKYGTRMPVDSVGNGILETTDPWMCFTPDEGGRDCGMGRIVLAEGKHWLTDADRGIFGTLSSVTNDYQRGQITSFERNETLHFAVPNNIFLRRDGTAFAHPRSIFYTISDGMYQRTPVDGDIRLNDSERQWETYSAAAGAWEQSLICWLGYAVPTTTGGCNFARGVPSFLSIAEMAAAPFFSGGVALIPAGVDRLINYVPNTRPVRNRRQRGRNIFTITGTRSPDPVAAPDSVSNPDSPNYDPNSPDYDPNTDPSNPAHDPSTIGTTTGVSVSEPPIGQQVFSGDTSAYEQAGNESRASAGTLEQNAPPTGAPTDLGENRPLQDTLDEQVGTSFGSPGEQGGVVVEDPGYNTPPSPGTPVSGGFTTPFEPGANIPPEGGGPTPQPTTYELGGHLLSADRAGERSSLGAIVFGSIDRVGQLVPGDNVIGDINNLDRPPGRFFGSGAGTGLLPDFLVGVIRNETEASLREAQETGREPNFVERALALFTGAFRSPTDPLGTRHGFATTGSGSLSDFLQGSPGFVGPPAPDPDDEDDEDEGPGAGGPPSGPGEPETPGFFCLHPNTIVLMADGSAKPIRSVVPGDVVSQGGLVRGIGRCIASDWHQHGSTLVTGEHLVWEAGRWTPVSQSAATPRANIHEQEACNLFTANGIIATPDGTCFSDFTPTYQPRGIPHSNKQGIIPNKEKPQ